MSEVITCVLKFAFGLISNKVRTYGAEKLQDGGLTDQKFRGWIVRELDDIKFKLDGLSRMHLSASISFLKLGVRRLLMSFGESSESGNPSTSELPKDGKQSQNTTTARASSIETKPAQQSVTVEDAVALANAIGKLKLESKERFESAKESFKKAAEKACEAFHNTALSTNERILVSKVRIASGILEHVDDPEVAANDCLHYLQELHDMPAIQEIFSVHRKGGIKSVFKKESRAEIVETVTVISLILADFISKFTKQRMGVFDWPMIECGKRVVHPIHYDEESVQKIREMGITLPWNIGTSVEGVEIFISLTFLDILKQEYENMNPTKFVINSTGDIIRLSIGDNHPRKLNKATGEWQPFCLPPSGDKVCYGPSCVAIDDNDMVYVVSPVSRTLSVYSSDGQIINHCLLDFLKEELLFDAGITVTKDKSIVIYSFKDSGRVTTVYVCDMNGKLVTSFLIPLKFAKEIILGMFVSCDNSIHNQIKLATVKWLPSSQRHIRLYVYTQEGEFKRTFRLTRLAASRAFPCVTFDHVTKNYIVCSQAISGNEIIYIDHVSETGECRNSVVLAGEKNTTGGGYIRHGLISHPNGAMAHVHSNRVLYLRR